MEHEKQELLKLIDNLDWVKFCKTGQLFTNEFNSKYAIIMDELASCQKEKTIEQKLEELGFTQTKDHQNSQYGLYYDIWHKGAIIHMEYIINPEAIRPGDIIRRYALCIESHKTKQILDFANYLFNLKNNSRVSVTGGI